MRQLLLSGLTLVCMLSTMTATAEAQSRLWHPQALYNGGDLKTWMMQQKDTNGVPLADEEGFVCQNLLAAAWMIAEKRKVTDTVKPTAQATYTNLLANWFYKVNGLPCDNAQSHMTWAQFGEIGRQNQGFMPFTKAVIAEAKTKAETQAQANQQDSIKNEQAEAAARGLVYHVPDPVVTHQVARKTTTTTSAIEPTTTTQSTLNVPIMAGSELVRVVNLAQTRLPTAAEMHAFAKLPPPPAPMYSETTVTRPARPALRTNHSHSEAFLTDYFSDLPIMVEIARCESTHRMVQSDLRYQRGARRGQREQSFGFFQIHAPTWHAKALELGLGNYQTDAMHNVLLARHLYELEGSDPWRFSKHCWGPKAKQKGLLQGS